MTPTTSRRPYSVPVHSTQNLPFRVRLVQTQQDLLSAVHIRSKAYGRHVPVMAELLVDPEPEDVREDVLILIAESKFDNAIIGSLRLVPNFSRPLKIESNITLPSWLENKRLVEFMRLGVENGKTGRMVFSALAKAAYEICFHQNVDYILVTGRYPVELIYRGLQFEDLLGHPVPISYIANIPHRVFYFDVKKADNDWRENANRLYGFMAETMHPDIEVDGAQVTSRWGGSLKIQHENKQ